MTDLSDLPPLERIQRYLVLADDAKREAARAKGAARQSYLLIAEQWERLAAEVARKLELDKKGP